MSPSSTHARVILRFLLLLLLVANASCGEPHVAIEIDGQVPPSFTFEGAGAIPFLVVYELRRGLRRT